MSESGIFLKDGMEINAQRLARLLAVSFLYKNPYEANSITQCSQRSVLLVIQHTITKKQK